MSISCNFQSIVALNPVIPQISKFTLITETSQLASESQHNIVGKLGEQQFKELLSEQINLNQYATTGPGTSTFYHLKPIYFSEKLKMGEIWKLLIEKLLLSYTSRLTTYVLNLRNKPSNKILRGLAKVGTEVALPVLALAGAVETVARSILTGIFFLYSPINKKPFEKSLAYLKSSTFAVEWNIRNLYHNIMRDKLPEKEYEARTFFKAEKKI